MENLNCKSLYNLQDRILDSVFQTENEFYLTGGTCISRFYQEKRYSDDLDLFTNGSARFSFAIKNIKSALEQEFQLKTETDTKDFVRLRINGILQVDFVNDSAERFKDVIVMENNIIIDNIENILSNKLTAVLGRDNPKDIFDIYLISKYYNFSWNEILESAHRKSVFSNDDLILRLRSFPHVLLKSIICTDPHFLDNFKDEFPLIIEKIIQA
jgi:predicted nucleotidyltransferase component of viral defense system